MTEIEWGLHCTESDNVVAYPGYTREQLERSVRRRECDRLVYRVLSPWTVIETDQVPVLP